MPVVTKDNSANPFSIDSGIYRAIVTAIEDASGEHGPYLKWKFKILEPLRDEKEVDDEVTITGNTPLLLQDESKLGKWLKACGLDCADGDNIDTDDAEGAEVMVMVENKKGKGKNSDKTFSNVDKVAPVKKAKSEEPSSKTSKKTESKKASEKKAAKTDPEPEPQTENESKEEKEADEDLWDFD